MNVIKPKVEELSIRIWVDKSYSLVDKRIRSNGILFGTVEDAAKHLGITLKESDNGLIASAPKLRLQMFVEKLHFAGVKFSEA